MILFLISISTVCNCDHPNYLLTAAGSSPNNTVAIIGGVVVAVVLILAVTIIVIVCIMVYVWHRNHRTELPIQRDFG